MSDLISRSEEEWKAIQGYEGIYEVSNFGNVRSLPRYKRGNFDSRVFIEGKTIKKVKNNRGYYIVQLSKNNKVKNFSVHRLVAEAFIPNPNNFPQVNHKDEDKSNNRVSNLEWITLKRNINYGTRNKRMALTKGKNVKAFDDDGNFIMGFCSMAVAEKITGINQGDISRCTLGKTEHAGGYVWKIVNQVCVGNETVIEAETIRDKAIKWNNNSSKRVPYEFIDFIEGKRDIGVTDDVCEWEKGSSGYVGYSAYYSKCCTTKSKGLETQTHIISDWRYCPYCGKKIKVVE